MNTWLYTVESAEAPLVEVKLRAATYHSAAEEIVQQLDEGEKPQDETLIWILNPKHDVRRCFKVYAEIKIDYDAWEV